MFCGNCGKENLDGAVYCVECGNNMSGEGNGQKNNSSKNRKVGIIAVAAIALLVIIIIASSPRSYKSVIKTYFAAMLDADVEAIMELIPEKFLEATAEEEGLSKKDIDELIDEGREMLLEEYEYLDEQTDGDWDIDYKIKKANDLSRKDFDELYDSYYDEYDIKISDAKEVEVELTVKVKDEEENITMNLNVVKVGRSWYLDIIQIGTLGDLVLSMF